MTRNRDPRFHPIVKIDISVQLLDNIRLHILIMELADGLDIVKIYPSWHDFPLYKGLDSVDAIIVYHTGDDEYTSRCHSMIEYLKKGFRVGYVQELSKSESKIVGVMYPAEYATLCDKD